MPAALTVDGVGVDFSGFKAVNNVSMIIEEGELRVLLGANGAGKTTLMDLISGKTECTQGRVFLYDTDITNREEHEIARAGLGRKFQIPSVFKELSRAAAIPPCLPISDLGSRATRRPASTKFSRWSACPNGLTCSPPI